MYLESFSCYLQQSLHITKSKMKILITLTVLVVVAVSVNSQNYPKYPKPAYSSPAYPKPSYAKPSYDYAPVPYNFAYAVKDDYTYNDYGHQETSDGYAKTGSYYVLLPDGRMQTVTYKADENGYVADVSYKGEAKYPEYKPSYAKPVYPSYQPAYPKPAYKPDYPKYN
ncbi:cuticle protein 19-like [Daphnia carinata]|uniref:cuticle protein 19-like n=1 Tax=Daphnia carinata TaxID=120202 RepID=UPI00257F5A20|nr:cuticle protein 19-like [Daphnia carinata]